MSDEEVPLVWYDDKGTRHVVGKATVERVDETGIHIKGEIEPGVFEVDPSDFTQNPNRVPAEFAEKFKDPSRRFSFAPIGFFEY